MEKKLKSIIAAAAAIAATSMLSGCGQRAPGDAEVREAVKGRLVALAQSMSEGAPLTDKDYKELDDALAKLKVIGCKNADPKNGFNCDWTGTESIAVVGGSGRVVKGDSGWMLMKAGE
jgi:hypothetical protein